MSGKEREELTPAAALYLTDGGRKTLWEVLSPSTVLASHVIVNTRELSLLPINYYEWEVLGAEMWTFITSL